MNADADADRTILFTEWARQDIIALKELGMTAGDWKTLRGHLERIARMRNVAEHECVVELRMCDDVFRWKACNLRVVFEVDESTMTVWALALRDNRTYARVALRLKQVGVL